MTNIGFVIGNGESRKSIDLKKLQSYGKTYGCNAIYRDHSPSYLVAVDQPMIDEIIKFNAHYRSQFYIEERKENNRYYGYTNVNHYESNYPGQMDSGTFAALLATQNHNQIYMIGFDYISNNGKTNNIYKDTNNYRAKDQGHVGKATMESWYYRQMILCLKYPNHSFIRVNGNNFTPPIMADNFTNINIDDFIKQFDCLKVEQPRNEFAADYLDSTRPIWYQDK